MVCCKRSRNKGNNPPTKDVARRGSWIPAWPWKMEIARIPVLAARQKAPTFINGCPFRYLIHGYNSVYG